MSGLQAGYYKCILQDIVTAPGLKANDYNRLLNPELGPLALAAPQLDIALEDDDFDFDLGGGDAAPKAAPRKRRARPQPDAAPLPVEDVLDPPSRVELPPPSALPSSSSSSSSSADVDAGGSDPGFDMGGRSKVSKWVDIGVQGI